MDSREAIERKNLYRTEERSSNTGVTEKNRKQKNEGSSQSSLIFKALLGQPRRRTGNRQRGKTSGLRSWAENQLASILWSCNVQQTIAENGQKRNEKRARHLLVNMSCIDAREKGPPPER